MQHDMVLDFGLIDFSVTNWVSGSLDFPIDVDIADLYTNYFAVDGTLPVKHQSAGGQLYLNMQSHKDANGALIDSPSGPTGYTNKSLDVYLWYTIGSPPVAQPILLQQRAGSLGDLSTYYGGARAVMPVPPLPSSDVTTAWTDSVLTCRITRGATGGAVDTGAVRAWIGMGPVGFVGV